MVERIFNDFLESCCNFNMTLITDRLSPMVNDLRTIVGAKADTLINCGYTLNIFWKHGIVSSIIFRNKLYYYNVINNKFIFTTDKKCIHKVRLDNEYYNLTMINNMLDSHKIFWAMDNLMSYDSVTAENVYENNYFIFLTDIERIEVEFLEGFLQNVAYDYSGNRYFIKI